MNLFFYVHKPANIGLSNMYNYNSKIFNHGSKAITDGSGSRGSRIPWSPLIMGLTLTITLWSAQYDQRGMVFWAMAFILMGTWQADITRILKPDNVDSVIHSYVQSAIVVIVSVFTLSSRQVSVDKLGVGMKFEDDFAEDTDAHEKNFKSPSLLIPIMVYVGLTYIYYLVVLNSTSGSWTQSMKMYYNLYIVIPGAYMIGLLGTAYAFCETPTSELQYNPMKNDGDDQSGMTFFSYKYTWLIIQFAFTAGYWVLHLCVGFLNNASIKESTGFKSQYGKMGLGCGGNTGCP